MAVAQAGDAEEPVLESLDRAIEVAGVMVAVVADTWVAAVAVDVEMRVQAA
jgi:hypothetical protein